MARKMISIDSSGPTHVVQCPCGFRGMGLTVAAARTIADRHRLDAHPRQAQYVESKRRTRSGRVSTT